MSELTVDVRYTEKHNRLTTLFRGILVIPHLIVAYFWAIVADVMAFLQWFIVVFTGKRNEALWDIQWGWLAYYGRVTAYYTLLFDEYPAFGTDPGRAPMLQELRFEEPASRLTNGLRVIWIIPALVISYVLGIALSVVLIIVWFAVIITGKFPAGMFDFALKVLRYLLQVNAYALLMTDTYPKWGSGVLVTSGVPGTSPPPSPPPAGLVPPPL